MIDIIYSLFIKSVIEVSQVKAKRIIELGSLIRNKNSVRFEIAKYEPSEYIGIDKQAGLGVDQVCLMEETDCLFEVESFDVVIVTAGLEEVEDYAKTISVLKRLCKKNGVIILKTRTPACCDRTGEDDVWRYELPDIETLFADCQVKNHGSDTAGTTIFTQIIKPENFVEIEYENIELYHMTSHQRVKYDESLFGMIKPKIEQTIVNPSTGYFSQYALLDQLGVKRATDKSSLIHNYLRKYEFFLQSLREESFTFLELGVFQGASIKMWHDYFPNAKIIGVDINPACKEFTGERKHILIADLSKQRSVEVLASLNPRVIIDDASHLWSHQIMALFTLFDRLPSGGIYILEDIGTSLDMEEYPNYDDAPISAYDVLSQIAEVCTGKQKLRVPIQYQEEIEKIGQTVEMISFIQESCIIIKK